MHDIDAWIAAVSSGKTILGLNEWAIQEHDKTTSVVVKMPIHLYVEVDRDSGKIIRAVVDDCIPVVITDETEMFYANPVGVPTEDLLVEQADRDLAEKSLKNEMWPVWQCGW